MHIAHEYIIGSIFKFEYDTYCVPLKMQVRGISSQDVLIC